jgi:hypothetical protein
MKALQLSSCARIMALIIMMLLTLHLSQDVVYGYEPSTLQTLAFVPIGAAWLYFTLALAGRRGGYVLLLLGGFLAAVVPFVHMSSRGVRAEVVHSPGGLIFMWTLMALAISAGVAFLLALHGFWRCGGDCADR